MHLLVRWILAPLCRFLYRPHVQGADRVPRRGPVILAANHRAAVDTAAIALTAGRPVSFLGKAEYFTGRGLRGRALARVPARRWATCRSTAATPRPGSPRCTPPARSSTRAARSRSTPRAPARSTGGCTAGHTGVASLALATGAVVVPVALVGTERVQPIGARFPRLHRVTVRYGEPLDFARYEGLGGSAVIRRAVTDEVMAAIAALSSQEYVDRYHERPAA